MKRAGTEGSYAEQLRLVRRARAAGAVLRRPFRLPHAPGDHPSARIELGRGAFLGPHAWLNVRGVLEIGEGTAIGDSFSVSVDERVTIGPGCLLSARNFILDANHDYAAWILPALHSGGEPRMTWDMEPPRPVSIGAGSWLGVGVVVMPGVTIGEGCVVGANSVVTASLEPYTVAAGVPARPIRRIELPG